MKTIPTDIGFNVVTQNGKKHCYKFPEIKSDNYNYYFTVLHDVVLDNRDTECLGFYMFGYVLRVCNRTDEGKNLPIIWSEDGKGYDEFNIFDLVVLKDNK